MKSRRFELFNEMVAYMPAKGVFRAIELEEQMMKDDLANHRDLLIGDVVSLLSFSHFLQAAKCGEPVPHGTLPAEHIPAYQTIVRRLIDAGELPYTALDQFDEVYLSDFRERMA